MTNEEEIAEKCKDFVKTMMAEYNILVFVRTQNEQGFTYTHNHANPELIPNFLVSVLNQIKSDNELHPIPINYGDEKCY